MKNKLQLLFILMLVSFPLVCFSQPDSRIWKPLEYNYYYNKTVIRKPPDIPLVWTYKIITDDAREKRIDEIKKYDLDKSIKYQDYHHDVVLWEIDCNQRLQRVRDYIAFDKNEMVLERYKYNNNEWDSIITNSRGETLYKKVCIPEEQSLERRSEIRTPNKKPSAGRAKIRSFQK